MRTQKKTYDFKECISAIPKPNPSHTPRNKLSSVSSQFLENSRRSVTPTKMHDRVSNSPLRLPLSRAIQNVSRNLTPTRSPNRNMGKSSRRQENSTVSVSRRIFYQEDPHDRNTKAHTETLNFVKKYFDLNSPKIPTQQFIRRLLQEYQGLWGSQNVEQIVEDFTYKIQQIFDGEYVDTRELIGKTKTDGMIGLILHIFKQIKNQQTTRMSNYNSFLQQPSIIDIHKSFQSRITQQESIASIKNVIQQFMETMYQCMENQIYNKFNIEMRRMVLKYRDAEKIIKKVNQKLTAHADVFDLQKKMRQRQRCYEQRIQELTKGKDRQELVNQRDKQTIKNCKNEIEKLENEINRLKESLQKYQNAILSRALQNQRDFNVDHTLSRRASTNSVFTDKACEYNNTQNQSFFNNNLSNLSNMQMGIHEPFKIQIDTHILHGDPNSKPTIHSVATFNPPNTGNLPLSLSPSKKEMQNKGYASRSSYGNRYANINTSPYTSKPFR